MALEKTIRRAIPTAGGVPKIGNQMRIDWDARGAKNAMYFTDGHYKPGFWDPDVFFADGEKQAVRLLQPVAARLGFVPAGKRLLEIGCGIGRLFQGFSRFGFQEIGDVDVSPEMVKRGRVLCRLDRARFVLGTGEDLSGFDDGYFDYCFSYVVFQHVPHKRLLWRYLSEVHRVLRVGGVFQLHFKRTCVLTCRFLVILATLLRPLAGVLRRLFTLSWLRGLPVCTTECVPGSLRTWVGTSVAPEEVVRGLLKLGFADVEILKDPSRIGGTRFWAIGRKA